MLPFSTFGALHAATVSVILLAIALVVGWGAKQSLDRARRVGRGLGVLLIVYYVVESAMRVWWLGVDPVIIWPVELCSVLFFIGAASLWWGHRQGFAIVTLWTFTFTLQALITPQPGTGFPSIQYIRYFVAHGLLVLVATYVLVALAERPTRRETFGAALALQGWEVFIGIVDWVTGMNFLYLREPPPSPTLVDFLGPWPWYILGFEVVGILSFVLLYNVFKLVGRVPIRRQPEPGSRDASAAIPMGARYDLTPQERP